MEKQRIKSNSKSRRRLLGFLLLLCCSTCFGQVLTSSMIKELRISPIEEQLLFTNTTIKFELNLPYVKPNQIELFTPETQNNVSFKTMRKSENYSEGGTKVELWLSFEKAGTYKLKPLNVRVRNSLYKIQFEEVTIGVNPMELVPVISVNFNKESNYYSENRKDPVLTVKAGEKLRFRINLKYAVQLVQYNWELPKDSIFAETKKYEITELKHRDRVYSEEIIPVADYEWIPLVPGIVELPVFNLSAIGYNGRRTDLQLPKLYVKVENGESSTDVLESHLFDSAFDFTDKTAGENDSNSITREVCIKLADMRSKERLALSFTPGRERAALENEYGLPSNQNEFSVMILFAAIFLTLFFTFLFIIFIRKRLLGANIINGIFLLVSIILLIFSVIRSTKDYAVSLDCKIYSIPEASAESKSEIPAGNRVEIKEEVSDWYFVQLGESGGWCRKDEVIIIK